MKCTLLSFLSFWVLIQVGLVSCWFYPSSSMSNFILTFPQFLCKLLHVLRVSCIRYHTFTRLKFFLPASQSRASCFFYFTFSYLLKSFFSSMYFLCRQMRDHETHRNSLKCTRPLWWTKRFNQNRNTHLMKNSSFYSNVSLCHEGGFLQLWRMMWLNQYCIEKL